MASIVRDTGVQRGSAVASDSANFGVLPAVGNHVVVGSAIWNDTDPSMTTVSDNQSNSYAEDIERAEAGVDSGASLWSAKVATSSGTFTVTVDPPGTVWMEWCAVEVAGLDATTHLDKTGTGSAASGNASATAGSANATASGIAWAVASVASNDTDNNINDTPPTGYTIIAYNIDAQATQGYAMAYKIYSSSETSSATFSHDAVGAGWSAVIATYKDANTQSQAPRTMDQARRRRTA